MLHIFLTILKIIGILLAFVLGLLIILLLCVLFWPVRYKVKGSYKDDFRVCVKVGFLGPLVRFRLQYEEELIYKLRIFGFPFMSSEKKVKQKKKKNHKNSNNIKQRKNHKEVANLIDEEEPVIVLEKSSKEEAIKENSKKTEVTKEDSPKENNTKTNVSDPRKISLWEKIGDFINKVKNFFKSLWSAVKRFLSFLSSVKEVIEDERVKLGYGKVKDEVFLLIRKIRPRKFRCNLKMGFEDPSLTGKLLGVIAVVRGMWNCEIAVEPDFEDKVLETDFEAKGFIQGFRIVRIGWKFLFDKDIKYLFKRVQNIRR